MTRGLALVYVAVMAKPKTPARLTVHDNLRAWRLAQGYTQPEIAVQLGRSQEWLSRAERGQIKVGADDLLSWAEALNLNIWQAYYQEPPQAPATSRAAG